MDNVTSLILSMGTGAITGFLTVAILGKMSWFNRLILILSVLCLAYIWIDTINVYIIAIATVTSLITLALCKVAKDNKEE